METLRPRHRRVVGARGRHRGPGVRRPAASPARHRGPANPRRPVADTMKLTLGTTEAKPSDKACLQTTQDDVNAALLMTPLDDKVSKARE